jgi:hypothetical protein
MCGLRGVRIAIGPSGVKDWPTEVMPTTAAAPTTVRNRPRRVNPVIAGGNDSAVVVRSAGVRRQFARISGSFTDRCTSRAPTMIQASA